MGGAQASGATIRRPWRGSSICSPRSATQRAPIFHIRHEGTKPTSSFLPGGTGYPVKDEARERDGEPVIVKRVNSAFIGTDLEKRLRAAGIRSVVICGATTNHCVETTTRMAGNLGFDARLVRDATWTFDRVGPDGDAHAAEDIHAMTLSNLNGEFATDRDGGRGDRGVEGRVRSLNSSCPALCRASTSLRQPTQDVDGRDKPGHDDG